MLTHSVEGPLPLPCVYKGFHFAHPSLAERRPQGAGREKKHGLVVVVLPPCLVWALEIIWAPAP